MPPKNKKARHKPKRTPPRAGKGQALRDDKVELFILEYLKDQNATRSARDAGYSENSAGNIGWELLTRPHVKQRILNALAERKARLMMEGDEILLGIKEIAVADPRRIFNLETGCILPPSEWPDDVAGAIASFEVKEIRQPFTGEVIGHVKKVKFWDKPKSQENLGRNQGLFKDVLDNRVSNVSQATPEQVDEASKKFKGKL